MQVEFPKKNKSKGFRIQGDSWPCIKAGALFPLQKQKEKSMIQMQSLGSPLTVFKIS